MLNIPHKGWNGLQEQTWTNKEITPPKIKTKINKLGRRNMVPTFIPTKKMDKWNLGKNNEYNGRSQIILRKISKFWNIPLTLCLNHLNAKTRLRKVDPTSVLIDEDDKIVELFYFVVIEDDNVKTYPNQTHPFKDGLPKSRWWYPKLIKKNLKSIGHKLWQVNHVTHFTTSFKHHTFSTNIVLIIFGTWKNMHLSKAII